LFINISELLDKAFTRFSHPEIVPIKKLKHGLNIMELFHGTTWAFKDLALSCVGQFLEYFLSKRQSETEKERQKKTIRHGHTDTDTHMQKMTYRYRQSHAVIDIQTQTITCSN
jgi:hypothetical protein